MYTLATYISTFFFQLCTEKKRKKLFFVDLIQTSLYLVLNSSIRTKLKKIFIINNFPSPTRSYRLTHSYACAYIYMCVYMYTYRRRMLTFFLLLFHILVFKIFFCSQCKWSLVHLLSPRTVMSHHLTNMHAFATKRHFNWELSHPSSPLGLVKIFICLLELISACLSPAGDFRVV